MLFIFKYKRIKIVKISELFMMVDYSTNMYY